MRGHKHPLEIFRESGRAFLTRDQGAQSGAAHEGLAEASRRGLKGAYLERARELVAGRREARVTSPSDVAVQKSKGASAPKTTVPEIAERPTARDRGEAGDRGAAARRPEVAEATFATAARPGESGRREWAAKGGSGARTSGGAGQLPLRSVAVVLTALVLLVGGSYAFRFWPFASKGASGEGSTSLNRFERWRIPSERAGNGASDPEPTAEGHLEDPSAPVDGATPSGSPAATASAEVEYWVLAGSENLTDARRKDWKQRWGLERQRIAKAFGEDFAVKFPGMKIQLCAADRQESEALLRIGPAASAQDAKLLQALADVRALGGSFAKAYVKKFRKQ